MKVKASAVASYHGSAMPAVRKCCLKLYYREELMVVIAEEDCINHGGQYQGMDRPLIVVVAAHHRRLKSMGD